ncbi:MAG: hypothetical protein AAGF30_02790 [Pseudomonadota bacterium]
MDTGDEIDTHKRLKAWLKALPQETPEEQERAREIAVTLAFRFAARVFPLVVEQFPIKETPDDSIDLTTLPVFRRLLFPLIVSPVPIDVISEAIDFAGRVNAARHALEFGSTTSRSDLRSEFVSVAMRVLANAGSPVSAAARATSAADAATAAAHAAAARDVRSATDNAAAAALPTAIAADDAADFAADAVIVERGRHLAFEPLWPDANPLASNWARGKDRLAQAEDDWSPVIAWYEHLLDPNGRALNQEMLVEIVRIPTETWDAGPEAALPVIKEIWDRYHQQSLTDVVRKANDGVVVAYDAVADTFTQSDVPAENPTREEAAVLQLKELVALVEQSGNLSGVLGTELFLIRRAVEAHPENAVMLHFNARTARGILAANIESQACPSATVEPVVGVLSATLLQVETSLAEEPEVRDSLNHPGDAAALVMEDDALEAIEAASEEVAEVSDADLAAELAENVALAKDAMQPLSLRDAAMKSVVSVLVQVKLLVTRAYGGMKAVLEEGDEVTKRMAAISKNVAVIGGTSYGAILVAEGSGALTKAIEYIIKLF